MQIDPLKLVPCDPAGKFSDDCEVMFDDGLYDYEIIEELVQQPALHEAPI